MYYKEVNLKSNKECFDFLRNHFTYDTMNSWNKLRSIANNVKLYNLPVDYCEAAEALEYDDYFAINETIKDWEEDHPGYEVVFNGRSGGYLVLMDKGHNGHVFIERDGDSPCNFDDYEEWKKCIKYGWGSLKAYHPTLEFQVKLVQEFDKLCDDLVEVLKSLIEDMKKRKSLTRQYSATLRYQRYYYDYPEDLKLHMLDMKRRGYSVWEYDLDDLWAEYEMNESIESEIILDEEGDEEFIK